MKETKKNNESATVVANQAAKAAAQDRATANSRAAPGRNLPATKGGGAQAERTARETPRTGREAEAKQQPKQVY